MDNQPEYMQSERAQSLYAYLKEQNPTLTEGQLYEMVWSRLEPGQETANCVEGGSNG